VVNYIDRSRAEDGRATKDEMRSLMDDVWAFVTPTMRGIPNTKILRDGIERYTAHRELDFGVGELVIPRRREMRPPLAEVTSFLAAALSEDVPVAFLSLDNGEEKRLDTWHWVVLVSVEYDRDADTAGIEVIDECRLFEADLRKWYDTTAVGGGFVSMRPR
jgi:hypothetical protein